MSMIRDAVKYIVDLAQPACQAPQSGQYIRSSQGGYQRVEQPMPEDISAATLQAVVDFVNQHPQKNDLMVHIAGPSEVYVLSRDLSSDARRACLLSATTNLYKDGDRTGDKLDQETFIIWLQAAFEPSKDRDSLIKLAQSLEAKNVKTSTDDGITQEVAVKASVYLKDREAAPQRVKLKPYRTFREVPQPESEFVFRVHNRGEDSVPLCALYDASGNSWKLRAINEVQVWLGEKMGKEVPILS